MSSENYLTNVKGTVYLIFYDVHFDSLRAKLVHEIIDLASSNCVRIGDNVCLVATNISLGVLQDKLQSVIESSDTLIITPLLKSTSSLIPDRLRNFIINGEVDKPMR